MLIKDTSSIKELDRKSKTKSPLTKISGSLFSDALNSKQHECSTYEEEIAQLKKEIDLVGEKLEKEPVLDNFKRFRDLLGRLAKRISAEAYQLEKVGGTPHNPRYFEIITIINAEADRLYNLIVMEQRDRMAITAKVIGIKGLVVDLIT
jgi:uncharacterized protein YaaR (DUF327 family)